MLIRLCYNKIVETINKKTLFWDVESLDSKKDSDFIIGRILNFGDIDDFKWAIKRYGWSEIKKNILKNKQIDRKSFSFWLQYFNINKSLCLRKRLMAKQSAFWKK